MKSLFKLICIAVLMQVNTSDVIAQPKLWGTLPYSGDPGAGLVYEFNLDGKIMTDIHAFEKYEGESPQNEILLADNNKFYGIANGGYGQFGSFIYEYDPVSNDFIVVRDFYDPGTGVSYSGGGGYLMQASDGLIYGFTQNSGANGDGQLFAFDPSDKTFNYLADFEFATTGSWPVGVLTETPDGKLYGVTDDGGVCNYGVLYSYDPVAGTLTSERSFDWADGADPVDGLILASNGLMYGMTYAGGGTGDGVIYSYEPGTGIYTMLHEFNTNAHGGKPYGRLFEASDGDLYGMASAGGLNGDGIIFKYDLDFDLFVLRYNFDGADGAYPNGSFIEYEGSLYAMTTEGGINHEGILFRYDMTANMVTKLADFYGDDYGRYPYGSLTIGPEGKLFGQAYLGGRFNAGIMFDFNTTSGVFTKRFDFKESDDGAINIGSMILGNDGWVYGMTYEGGQYNGGTIYRINPADREFESLYDFDIYSYGSYPIGGLMQAEDGFFYGTTPSGGTVNGGILFRFDANNQIVTVLEDLITPSEGIDPTGPPVQAANGNLYGLMEQGGAMGDGALYRFNLSNGVYSKVADFQSAASGGSPVGSLVEAANGKLYGLANNGGQFGQGTLFEYDPAGGNFNVVVHFDGTNNGARPYGTLLKYQDNILYGICTQGGTYGHGTLFMYDTEAAVSTKVHDFNAAGDGAYPYGSPMKASNGKIYGTTTYGGSTDNGILYAYDPESDDYTILHEFETFREHPHYSALLEVETFFGIGEDEREQKELTVFPNPVRDILSIRHERGNVNISIYNQSGQLILNNAAYISDEKTELKLGYLETGIYFIRIVNADGQSSATKFLKAN